MLKVGLIGVGHLGTIHLSQLLQIDGIQVVGVFDADDHQARKGVAETGVPVYDRADLLMEAAEAIDIVSPTASHFQYAVDGIAKGKHVFIEKPLAGSVEQAEKIAGLPGRHSLFLRPVVHRGPPAGAVQPEGYGRFGDLRPDDP
jgi:predicted dehydrogenase